MSLDYALDSKVAPLMGPKLPLSPAAGRNEAFGVGWDNFISFLPSRTLPLAMPVLPAGFPTVTSWLKNKSQSELWSVVQQGNPQEVIPYSLALITVLNQVRAPLR